MMRAITMRRLVPIMLASTLVACGDDIPDEYMDMDTPIHGSDTGGTTTTSVTTTSTTAVPDGTTGTPTPATDSSDEGPATVGIPDECEVSSECGRGEYCVAPFDPELGPEGKGPNECVSECVVIMDELRWCLDASACCDAEAECTDRGYCVFPGESSDSGTGDSGDTDGGSGTGTTG